MNLNELLNNKEIKAKAKVAEIGDRLLSSELPVSELLTFANTQKGTNKATCIEAMEYATKKQPDIADENLLSFVIASLTDKEPRIKWESAKVIGNVVGLFPDRLAPAINNLLINAEHEGTVVRWAAAYALAEIAKLKTHQNEKLIPAIEDLYQKEADNGVKKKYLDAIKKIKK